MAHAVDKDRFTFTAKDRRNYRTRFLGNSLKQLGGFLLAAGLPGLRPGQKGQFLAGAFGTRLQPDPMKLAQMQAASDASKKAEWEQGILKAQHDFASRFAMGPTGAAPGAAPGTAVPGAGPSGLHPSAKAFEGPDGAPAAAAKAQMSTWLAKEMEGMDADQQRVLYGLGSAGETHKYNNKRNEFKKANAKLRVAMNNTKEAQRAVKTVVEQVARDNPKVPRGTTEFNKLVSEALKLKTEAKMAWASNIPNEEHNKMWTAIITRSMKAYPGQDPATQKQFTDWGLGIGGAPIPPAIPEPIIPPLSAAPAVAPEEQAAAPAPAPVPVQETPASPAHMMGPLKRPPTASRPPPASLGFMPGIGSPGMMPTPPVAGGQTEPAPVPAPALPIVPLAASPLDMMGADPAQMPTPPPVARPAPSILDTMATEASKVAGTVQRETAKVIEAARSGRLRQDIESGRVKMETLARMIDSVFGPDRKPPPEAVMDLSEKGDRELFDEVFGAGTAEKILGPPVD